MAGLAEHLQDREKGPGDTDPVVTLTLLRAALHTLATEHAMIHPDQGDAPTWNEGGIGYACVRAVEIMLAELKQENWLVVQQGGASAEWYSAIHDSDEEAWRAIQSHKDASYDAIGPYKLPPLLNTQSGELYDVINEVASDAIMENFPEVPEEYQSDEDKDDED